MDDSRKPPLGSDDATIVPEASGSYSVPSRDAAATLTPIPQGETPVPGRPSDASPTRVSTSSAYFSGGVALQPGTVLVARYEILKVLGEGGMGAVYRAKDRELDRVVALTHSDSPDYYGGSYRNGSYFFLTAGQSAPCMLGS